MGRMKMWSLLLFSLWISQGVWGVKRIPGPGEEDLVDEKGYGNRWRWSKAELQEWCAAQRERYGIPQPRRRPDE